MSLSIRQRVNRFTDYDHPGSVGRRMRARRIGPLVQLIEGVHAERGAVRMIDVGGTVAYWRILPPDLLERCNVHVTLVNLPDAHPGTRSPDAMDQPSADPDRFTHVVGDGCDLSRWEDDAFDIAHSNSVLEHVGDWDHVVRFAREVRRVARFHFLQTPHFWFPVEPHCMVPLFHWLPRSWRLSMVTRWKLGNWSRQPDVDEAMRTIESARLLDRRMFEGLFAEDSVIRTERFFGLPKSMIAISGTTTSSSAG